jgi:hypothetical protein
MIEIAISRVESLCKRRRRGVHPSAPVPSPFPTERKLVRRSTVSNPSIIVTPPGLEVTPFVDWDDKPALVRRTRRQV